MGPVASRKEILCREVVERHCLAPIQIIDTSLSSAFDRVNPEPHDDSRKFTDVSINRYHLDIVDALMDLEFCLST